MIFGLSKINYKLITISYQFESGADYYGKNKRRIGRAEKKKEIH